MKNFLLNLFLSKTPFLNQGDLRILSIQLLSHYFFRKFSNFFMYFFKNYFPQLPDWQFNYYINGFLFLTNTKKPVELISKICLLHKNFTILKINSSISVKKKTEKRVFKVAKKMSLRKLKKLFFFGLKKIFSINIFKGRRFFFIMISDLCFFSKISKNKIISKIKKYFKIVNLV